MAEPRQVTHLDVVELGPLAARALRRGTHGAVGAVFERSFYAVFDGQWVCFGASDIGSGPLNAVYACAANRPRSLPPVGGRAVVGEGAVSAHGLVLSIMCARPWRAAGIGHWDSVSLEGGLATLQRSLAGTLPDDGLAPLLANDRPAHALPRIASAALAPSRHLEAMIAAAREDRRIDGFDLRPLIALLGLGPGLTPSGDDFIGGAMIALHLLGRADVRDCIWSGLESRVNTATNEISQAHLQAAAEGFGAGALHELICAVMADEAAAIAAGVSAIGRLGHTSGWDALAGATIVLQAWSTASAPVST